MKMRACVAASFFAGLAIASPASAQPNTAASPNFGTITLNAGFGDDPRVIPLTSGGRINARTLGGNCVGHISRAPDVRLNYRAGRPPLIISVASSADTSLIISGPDGRWFCDDDGGLNGLNPMVRFGNPQSGRYEIWVGSIRAGTNARARLHISEIGSQ